MYSKAYHTDITLISKENFREFIGIGVRIEKFLRPHVLTSVPIHSIFSKKNPAFKKNHL
jgi:hypothetical protein